MNLRRLAAMASKEWTHIRRDPRSLAVALILPIALLVIMGAGINFDLTELPFAVCDLDNSQASRTLWATLAHSDLFRLAAAVSTAEAGERLVRERRCLFLLVIPPGMEEDLSHSRTVRLQMLLDGSDSNTASIARHYLEGALQKYSTDLLADTGKRLGLPATAVLPPITVAQRILYNPGLASRQFFVPGLIVSILVILGALLTSGTIVRERERGTFETLAASPLLATEMLLGKLIPYMAIGFTDVLITVATGALVFHVYVAGSVELLLLCAVVFLIASLGLGLLISTIAPTQQLAMTLAIVATLLPATLISGFAFPVRNMPVVLQWLSALIPATHFLVIARAIYLKGVGLSVIWPPLLKLTALATLTLVLALKRFRKQLS